MDEILLKNAHLVNGKFCDILIKDKKIANIGKDILVRKDHVKTIDLEGNHYVSAGWIDIHTHCFNKFELYSDDPDEIGYKTGVTTVIDAGTVGADDVDEFYKEIQKSITNVFAFINISRIGIRVQSELSNIEDLNTNEVIDKYKKYKNFIVGIKVRMSRSVVGKNGITPLLIAKKISKSLNLPIMVHVGTEPPRLDEVLNELDKGDIVSHIFNGKNNGIVSENGDIKKEVTKAKDRGVIFDIAHGKESFNFNVAKIALENHLDIDTISTDIYRRNRIDGPVYDLTTTMEKALYLGYSIEEVIDKVTQKAAEIVGIPNKGKMEAGYDADLTVFDICNEKKCLIDSNGNKVNINTVLKPKAVLINGEYIEI